MTRRNSGNSSSGRPDWPGRMRRVDKLSEHRCHRHEVTVVSLRTGSIVPVRIHADPVDMVSGLMSELGKECPLSPAITLPERMHGIHVREEFRRLPDELLTVKPAQPVSRRQSAEDIMRIRVVRAP